jgi:hypothetical protein
MIDLSRVVLVSDSGPIWFCVVMPETFRLAWTKLPTTLLIRVTKALYCILRS